MPDFVAMKFCMGYGFSHQRALSEDERGLLERRLNQTRIRRIVTLVLAWIVPFSFVPLYAACESFLPAHAVETWAGVTFMVGMLIAPSWAILMVRDAKRRYRLVKASTEANVVDVYIWPKWQDHDPYFPIDLEGVAEFQGELMRIPETGLLLNGLMMAKPKFIQANADSVAPQPMPPPQIAPPRIPIAPIELTSGRSALEDAPQPDMEIPPMGIVGERMLSAPEIEELKMFMHRISSPKWWAYALAIYLTVGSLAFFWIPHSLFNVIRSAVHFTGLVGILIYLVRAYRDRKNFRLDLIQGVVEEFIYQEHKLEMLPNTGYVWTSGGLPSHHRRFGATPEQL